MQDPKTHHKQTPSDFPKANEGKEEISSGEASYYHRSVDSSYCSQVAFTSKATTKYSKHRTDVPATKVIRASSSLRQNEGGLLSSSIPLSTNTDNEIDCTTDRNHLLAQPVEVVTRNKSFDIHCDANARNTKDKQTSMNNKKTSSSSNEQTKGGAKTFLNDITDNDNIAEGFTCRDLVLTNGFIQIQDTSFRSYDVQGTVSQSQPLKTFAFVDSETKEVFSLITLETKNSDLCKIFNEQKRRQQNDSSPLVLVEMCTVNECRIIRQLSPKEATPQHYNSAYYKTILHKKIIREIHELEIRMDNPYEEPDEDALRATYSALSSLLGQDCESFGSVRVAAEYYQYWRPTKPKVILLAESHVSTPQELSCDGPVFDKSLLDGYDGPQDFCSLVYCLAYGENAALKERANSLISVPRKDNAGTWQFWNLFSACISSPDQDPSSYGKDIQKSSKLPHAERIQKKFQILKQMKEKGIWLIDASIIGWYIQQQTNYDVAKNQKRSQNYLI